MEKHKSHAFLVNSGWSGGPYGVGERMSIKTTRACVNAILDGSIHNAEFVKDPIFGFERPTALPNIDSHLLDPRSTWPDKNAYDQKAKDLGMKFIKNFKKYEGVGTTDYTKFGPQV